MSKVLAPKSHWDEVWEKSDLPQVCAPEVKTLRNHGKNEFHRFFCKCLKDVKRPASLVEFGCAQSSWLPYFHRYHGLAISGIDFSPMGCERMRLMLKRENIAGKIVDGDFFDPNRNGLEMHDIGFSYGVIEHFENPSVPLRAMAGYIKPGGMIISIVPNMYGIVGQLQKQLNRPIFDMHNRIDASDLTSFHLEAGLTPMSSTYLVSLSLAVVNPGEKPSKPVIYAMQCGRLITALSWLLDRSVRNCLPRTKLFSPYVAGHAKV